MMTSWRTIVAAGEPSLLALDVKNGSDYFALDVSEGNARNETILRGRVTVVDREITEMELIINRYRGDHGFCFSAKELPSNYAPLMSPPANRKRATREELIVSVDLFATYITSVNVSDDCRFTELGWTVIDPGTNGNGSSKPISCGWPDAHPYDANARAGLVIDEELGFAVQSGMVPGRVFAYANVSAFIPNTFTAAQQAQIDWFNIIKAEKAYPLLRTLQPPAIPWKSSSTTMGPNKLYKSSCI